MEELFKTIPAFIDDEETPDEIRNAVILAAWKKAAGAALSSNAVASELTGKTLRVAVRDETWKRHLESLAGQMIFKLNSLLRSPAVTYIEFFVDEEILKEALAKKPERNIPREVFEREAENERTGNVESASLSISDPELGRLFLDAAANCLARKRLMIERGLVSPSETRRKFD